MKNSKLKQFLIICGCVIVGIALFAGSVAAAVHATFAIIDGGPLSFSSYRKLDSQTLDYEGKKLESLSGIERCSELRELSVSGCDVTDFSPLYGLENLRRVNALGTSMSPEQYEGLRSALPGCEILWEVPFRGQRLRPDSVESLVLTDDDSAEYGVIRYFTKLASADINGCTFTPELAEVMKALPDCDFHWNVELFGKTFSYKDELIDLNDITVDLDGVIAGLERLPLAKQVELCGSGLSNEQMEQLMALFPDKKFVWRIKVGNWTLRTDVTSFSTGHVGFTMTYIHDESAQQLKYCRDLVALDLGHNSITDISFARYLSKLRTIIIVDTALQDISPLADIHNLEYVELFQNDIRDISALGSHKNLKEVNIAKNKISDFTPLYGNYQLEKLWIGINNVTPKKVDELKANIAPDCRVVWQMNYSDNPVEYGWRPIDYRGWGFKYDNPLNIGMIDRMEHNAPINTSHANIDPDAYGDEPYGDVPGENVSDTDSAPSGMDASGH